MSEFLSVDVKTSATGPDVVTFVSTGRHVGELDPGENSPAAEAFRLAARGVRAQADRDWIARRLRPMGA